MIDDREIYKEKAKKVLAGIIENHEIIDDMERDKALVSVCVALAEPIANIIDRERKDKLSDLEHRTHVYLCNKVHDILDNETNEFLLKLIYEYIKLKR